MRKIDDRCAIMMLHENWEAICYLEGEPRYIDFPMHFIYDFRKWWTTDYDHPEDRKTWDEIVEDTQEEWDNNCYEIDLIDGDG